MLSGVSQRDSNKQGLHHHLWDMQKLHSSDSLRIRAIATAWSVAVRAMQALLGAWDYGHRLCVLSQSAGHNEAIFVRKQESVGIPLFICSCILNVSCGATLLSTSPPSNENKLVRRSKRVNPFCFGYLIMRLMIILAMYAKAWVDIE